VISELYEAAACYQSATSSASWSQVSGPVSTDLPLPRLTPLACVAFFEDSEAPHRSVLAREGCKRARPPAEQLSHDG
jgi:hypothetical protein